MTDEELVDKVVAKIEALKAENKRLWDALEEMDLKAQAGLCAGTFEGARAFHEDIRRGFVALRGIKE